MAGINLARLACKHCRTFVAWAMVPLAALNGHTVIGCGCTGHFMSVCQCQNPDLTEKSLDVKTPTCPMCSGQAVKTASCGSDCDRNNSSTGSQGVRGHRCCSVAIYDFVPGTSNALAAGAQQQVLAVLSAPSVLPFVFSERPIVPELLIDPGHSDDLVVLLRRLLI
jgi:hypothetical protein